MLVEPSVLDDCFRNPQGSYAYITVKWVTEDASVLEG